MIVLRALFLLVSVYVVALFGYQLSRQQLKERWIDGLIIAVPVTAFAVSMGWLS